MRSEWFVNEKLRLREHSKRKFLTSQAFLKQSESERDYIENREELLCGTCSRDALSNFTDTENLLQYLFD